MAVLSSWRRPGLLARCAVALMCSLAPAARALAQAAPEALEYRVKAAYLLNFTRYVDWPPTAFSDSQATLNVCVVGRDPFGAVLERTLEGRRASGRLLHVLRPARPAAEICHVAFVGETTSSVREAWLAALETEPTLTVGDGEGFAQAGGMIGFVIVDERVRFEINVDAVRAGGLHVSSRVLTLATRLLPGRSR